EEIICNYYDKELQAPTPKTGKYLLADAPRDYPWERKGALDVFKLETPVHAKEKETKRGWLHSTICDAAAFKECLSTLSKNKAPGPDGIVNELLKMLPSDIHVIIHQLYQAMWATGITPTEWKMSDTALLYKKQDATDVKNYRPIGLANTLYKLFTRPTTHALYEYAEAHSILSSTQSGFRQMRDTLTQLQHAVHMLEDAKLSQSDIYALIVDFTSAFNTTDHDKMLYVMYDLGFPTDGIEIVRDLYTNAKTRVKLPGGRYTRDIQVERGTIQGDCLSPFLFLTYIEPLLRWFQAGGRGYKFACLNPPSHNTQTQQTNQGSGASLEQIKHALGGLGYADDLLCVTGSLSDLHIQAEKLSAYSDWAELKISASKTKVTGMPYRQAAAGLYGKYDPVAAVRAQLKGKILVQGTPACFLPPDEPFTYLGVQLTMTLNWRPQHAAMTSKLQERLQCIRASYATPRQVMRLIQQAIVPSIAYGFAVTPCTPQDIEIWDSMITALVKHTYGLMCCTPTAMVRADVDSFGLGATSLEVE
ncbi:MAG: reverse transcriptase family protein, partial [Spirochaetia bacterium]|nr:reverse transcriptase family protein [Spirochaetia bacterium]